MPTYFPGSTAAVDALPVEVRSGRDVPITIQLIAGRSATITGRFAGPDEALARGVTVQVRPVQGAPVGVTVRARSAFEFEAAVMPGDYILQGSAQGPGQTKYFGLANLSVQGDISDLVVPLTEGGTITGRIVSDGAVLSEATGARRSLTLMPAPGSVSLSSGSSTIQNDWSFEVTGIVGTYLIRSTPGPGWFLKTVRLGDTDITDAPLAITDGRRLDDVTVVLTQKQTQLTGDVTDAFRRPVDDFVVVVFAEETRLWAPRSRFIASARAGLKGEFSVRGLPPGRYLAAAVESLEPGEEFEPKVLARLQKAATRVTLGDGEATRITATLQK
jgi:hypothetical protein